MMPDVSQLSTPRPRQAALTNALLGIVAERGLDEVSVRDVATAAGVSIGTVQYYFPTKDAMLGAAFTEVVDRIRTRMQAIELGPDVRANLSALLRELLPVDARRAEETRIWLAFAARAAISPTLAESQRTVLTEIVDALTEGFIAARGERADPTRCRLAAQVTVAAADGLALHAVSSGSKPTRHLADPLEQLLDALLAEDRLP